MNLFVVGWQLPDGAAPLIRLAFAKTSEAYPQLDPSTGWEYGDGQNVFAGSMHVHQGALGNRRYVWRDATGVSFYDGSIVDSVGDRAFYDAQELALHWEEVPERLEGQYVVVKVSSDPASVEITTDFLGMRQVYFAALGQGLVLSNSATLLARLGGGIDLDPLGVSSLLSWGWATGDRTLLREVRVVPGGETWSWSADRGREERKSHYPRTKLASIRTSRLTGARSLAMAESLRALIKQLERQSDEVLLGLTGGRDSRLIASILRGAGEGIRSVTYAPTTSRDAVIAARVAEALDLAHAVEPPPEGGITEEWDRIAPGLTRQCDGLVDLGQVGVMLNREDHLDHLGIFIAGHGGEIPRGFYLEPLFLLSRPGQREVVSLLAGRLLESHGGLLEPAVERSCRAYLDEFVAARLDEGFAAADVPDAFYTYERVGRWASTVGIRPSLPVTDVFEPLCCRPFVEMSFGIPRSERYFESIHSRSTRVLAPELKSIAFDKRATRSERVVRDMLRWALRNDPTGKLARLRATAVEHADWIEPLVPRIREICLDQGGSDAWSFVNRTLFERITSREIESKERARFVPGLLRVATVFYYQSELASG
jgi:asparagine synthase (glutamine-hydrolysing)